MKEPGALCFWYLAEHQLAIPAIHGDDGAGGDAALQQLAAEHGLHGVLHIAAQGTGTKLGVIGLVHNELLGGIRQMAGDLLVSQAAVELVNLQVDDLGDVLLGQRLVEDNLIQTVQELRTEGPPQQGFYPLLGGGVNLAVGADTGQQLLRAQVGGQNQNGVLKVRPSSSTCSRTLNTSGWAFSTSSNSTTL